jgi:hypothetical protein
MDDKELKLRKERLENQISNLIYEFEAANQVYINKITVLFIEQDFYGEGTHFSHLVRVDLV